MSNETLPETSVLYKNVLLSTKNTAATESSVAAAFYFKIKISSYKNESINFWFF